MPMLELHVLRSGDKGSCVAVRMAGAQDFVCVDCGVSGATFAQACGQAGLVAFKVLAFLITHCHSNQVKGLKSTLTWLQKRGVAPTVYVEPGVLAASPALQELQGLADVREFHTKQPFAVGNIVVRPFRTFHNNEDKGSCYNFRFEARAAGGSGFSASCQDVPACSGMSDTGDAGAADSIVLLSDVGMLSREAQSELPGARLLAIEANYDSELLESAARANAQVRFAVDTRGNFSNAQAAAAVEKYAWPGLRDVVAMYLSRQYNTPERAVAALEEAATRAGCSVRVTASSPDERVSILPHEDAPTDNGMVASVSAPDGARACECAGAAAEVLPAEMSPAGGPLHADEPLPAGGPLPADEPLPAGGPLPADKASAGVLPSNPLPPEPPEDILACDQVQAMGYVDLTGLLTLCEQHGRFAAREAPAQRAFIGALTAAGLIDSRDEMPTDEGVELGVWAAYDGDGLAPIFRTGAADLLWERVRAYL